MVNPDVCLMRHGLCRPGAYFAFHRFVGRFLMA